MTRMNLREELQLIKKNPKSVAYQMLSIPLRPSMGQHLSSIEYNCEEKTNCRKFDGAKDIKPATPASGAKQNIRRSLRSENMHGVDSQKKSRVRKDIQKVTRQRNSNVVERGN